MSIENTLERIAVAFETLIKMATVTNLQSNTVKNVPTVPVEIRPVQPIEGKRGPGRPPKNPQPVQPAQPPQAEPDNFLDDPPSAESPEDFLGEPEVAPAATATPAKVYTRDEVRAELIKYGKRLNNSEAARKLLKNVGGVEIFQSLTEDKFNAVVNACNA